MSMSQEDRAHDKGNEDCRQGRYDPPGGSSWTTALRGPVFGNAEANKAYEAGRRSARADDK